MYVLLLQHGDIETNPRPPNEKKTRIFHVVIRMLTAYWQVTKIYHLEGFYIHYFICISETYFDSSVLEGVTNIQLTGGNLVRADHPSNTKWGGVCIIYKETLGIRIANSLSFTACILLEVSVKNSKAYIAVVCRSPSQKNIRFENFILNFEGILSVKRHHLGNFNVRSPVWWTKDKTAIDSTQLEVLTTMQDFHQLISQSTHILP